MKTIVIGTHNLLSASFSLIFSNTLISRRAASLYFSTFLIIFRATWAPPLENTKKYKAKSRDNTKPKMFYICYSNLTFGSRYMLNCRYASDISLQFTVQTQHLIIWMWQQSLWSEISLLALNIEQRVSKCHFHKSLLLKMKMLCLYFYQIIFYNVSTRKGTQYSQGSTVTQG